MNAQGGATLVEALAFTVIAIIFVISAVALWNMTSNSANAQNVVRQYQSMATDIQDLFQGQDDYTDISASLLIDAGVVPEDLQIRPNTSPPIVNTYGGRVDVRAKDSLAGKADQRFAIAYTNVPKEACISIASTLAGTFNQIKINLEANVANDRDADLGFGGPKYSGGLPLSVADAQAECTGVGSSAATNNIVYYSR